MTTPQRKRGRERIYDAQRTRTEILNAAEAVFAEHGFNGTSMDIIAQTSGYNKSLLFQYFNNKLGLYTQVLKRIDDAMSELMLHIFSPLFTDQTILSNREMFRSFLINTCSTIFDYMVNHPYQMRLFNWEQAEDWQTFMQIATQFEPADLAKFEELFLKARKASLLNPKLDVAFIVLLIQQICWSSPASLPLYQSLSSDATLAHLKEQVIAFLVAGIMNDSGTIKVSNKENGEK